MDNKIFKERCNIILHLISKIKNEGDIGYNPIIMGYLSSFYYLENDELSSIISSIEFVVSHQDWNENIINFLDECFRYLLNRKNIKDKDSEYIENLIDKYDVYVSGSVFSSPY